jgi:uncharacterized membrane protein
VAAVGQLTQAVVAALEAYLCQMFIFHQEHLSALWVPVAREMLGPQRGIMEMVLGLVIFLLLVVAVAAPTQAD